MSSALALVRFGDGRVRYGVYHGTSDILYPSLHDSSEAAWRDKHHGTGDTPPVMEPVIIYSDYGGGFWWDGEATRNYVAGEFCAPFGIEAFDGHVLTPKLEIHDERPDWVKDILGEEW